MRPRLSELRDVLGDHNPWKLEEYLEAIDLEAIDLKVVNLEAANLQAVDRKTCAMEAGTIFTW